MTGQKAGADQQLTLWGDPPSAEEVVVQPVAERKQDKIQPKTHGKEAKASKADTSPAAAAKHYTYPFNVRYAAEVLQLTGFVDGQPYTADQIKEVLVQNGYTEFQDVQSDFHHNEATNTLVITIRGSRKGGSDQPGHAPANRGVV